MIEDIKAMIKKYGFDKEVFDSKKLDFRILGLLTEEYEEILTALNNKDPEELVDGLIDLIVIAIGTLELSGVNVKQAWDEVMIANMSKERGTKKGREESGGFDLVKPEGWRAPSHKNNYGKLNDILKT
jgi:predicted HAD superfamily Cof-like phosphohydrolase